MLFRDLIIHTRACDIRVYSAGSKLKMACCAPPPPPISLPAKKRDKTSPEKLQ